MLFYFILFCILFKYVLTLNVVKYDSKLCQSVFILFRTEIDFNLHCYCIL